MEMAPTGAGQASYVATGVPAGVNAGCNYDPVKGTVTMASFCKNDGDYVAQVACIPLLSDSTPDLVPAVPPVTLAVGDVAICGTAVPSPQVGDPQKRWVVYVTCARGFGGGSSPVAPASAAGDAVARATLVVARAVAQAMGK